MYPEVVQDMLAELDGVPITFNFRALVGSALARAYGIGREDGKQFDNELARQLDFRIQQHAAAVQETVSLRAQLDEASGVIADLRHKLTETVAEGSVRRALGIE